MDGQLPNDPLELLRRQVQNLQDRLTRAEEELADLKNPQRHFEDQEQAPPSHSFPVR